MEKGFLKHIEQAAKAGELVGLQPRPAKVLEAEAKPNTDIDPPPIIDRST